MKQKQRHINKQAEWERLLEANIYIGDHMTRRWSRDDSAQKKPGQTGPAPAERVTCGGSMRGKHVSPGSPCHQYPKKQASIGGSNGRKRPKTGKEILSHVDITSEDLTTWQTSFDSLLKSEAGRFVFKSFLESEVADENLKFWLACESLKNTTKQKRAEKMAQSIYDNYINVFSPHEVNIDYKMRENIVDKMKPTLKVDVTIFSEAQDQIYTLMHRDSYPRFLSSSVMDDVTKEVLERESKTPKSKPPANRNSTGLIICFCCRRQGSVRETPNDSVVEQSGAASSRGAASTSGNAMEMKTIVKDDKRTPAVDEQDKPSPKATPNGQGKRSSSVQAPVPEAGDRGDCPAT